MVDFPASGDIAPIANEVPGLYLNQVALDANIAVVHQWCQARELELAPHIKTTMTRPIVERQLAAAAWGVTVATCRQGELGVRWGARRIIVANEIVRHDDVRRLIELSAALAGPEVYLFVDSAEAVEAAASVHSVVATAPVLPLLVDIGVAGGRTGVRSAREAIDLARLVHETSGVTLAGIAGYEGIAPNSREERTLAAVQSHCDIAMDLLESVRPLVQIERPLFSMGGSAFPDLVATTVARHRADHAAPFIAVLRSGCYVTHDHGTYAGVSPFPGLTPALHVRATVISTPEPGQAIIGAGRRELPSDAGLPILLRAYAVDGNPRPSAHGIATRIYDHHLVLTDAGGLHVGDTADLGISHPCSAFDRWPHLTVLDGTGQASETWPIQFH